MSSFVESVQERVESINQDAQIEGLLLEHKRDGPQPRPNWFYLKDLTNPQQAYWEHREEAPEYIEEQRQRFQRGNRIHKLARRAFSRVDGFAGVEATLDGAVNGLAGIRGKVDFRYGDSLVEFKTTLHDIEAAEDVWELAPQDIEQLLFYAALWTHNVSDHYLVYHLGDGPDSVRVFQATVEEPGLVENTLKSRKTNLQRALDVQSPSIVKRCRYCNDCCHIQEADLCDCEEHDEHNLEPLQRASEIAREEELETCLVNAFEEVENEPDPVKPWDLETPRQWYGRQLGERERDDWTPPDDWVPSALSSADLLPGPMENEYIPTIDEPLKFKASGFMVEQTRTTHEGEATRWVPALHRVRDYDGRPSPDQLHNQIMQLGCMCALSESRIGLLIIELPETDIEVVVYRVSFRDLSGIEAEIRERLEEIESAVEERDADDLPPCPDWLQEIDCENCLCQ